LASGVEISNSSGFNFVTWNTGSALILADTDFSASSYIYIPSSSDTSTKVSIVNTNTNGGITLTQGDGVGAGNFNTLEVNDSGVTIVTNVNNIQTGNWVFGTDGSTTLPIGVSIDESNGSQFPRIVADSGKAFSVQGQGSTGSVALQWIETESTSSQIAQVGLNKFGEGGLAAVTLTAGTSTNDMKIWRFDETGTLTLPDSSKAIGVLTSYFTGTIAGTTLTVTGATTGTIAWEQAIEGPGVAADTFIVTQLTGDSGGDGTYSVTVSQNVGPVTMNVAAMYLNAGLKLGVNHAIYQQDEDDTTLYNFMIGIEAQEATIHIGDINTNGVAIPNNKEYKGHSALNTGTYMAIAKVDSADQVILGSGNSVNTLIKVGGMGEGYGMKLFNGGKTHIVNNLKIGDNTNDSIFQAPLEVGSRLQGDPNNLSSPGGIGLPTYRGTATIVSNDEWGSYIYGSRYRGTINSPLPTKNGDWLMEFGATSFDGTNNNGGGEMAFRVDGTVTGSANPSRWELYVTPAGTNSQTLGLKVDSALQTTLYGNLRFADSTVQTTAYKSTSGSWTLATGSNTVSFTVPLNSNYQMWVNGNIPNGIVEWNATVNVSNTNVPAIGSQYAWYYAAGNALVLTAIPNQIIGTVGVISTSTGYVGTTANVFTFGITNNSTSSQVINWGYTTL
jgi:hypothetical protein